MIREQANAADLDQAERFAQLVHEDAITQIRAWLLAGTTEAEIVAASRLGVEYVRRAIGGILAVSRP